MEEAIVFYPSPQIGHLISMVELGKLIHTHHPSLSIHILITSPPYLADSTAPYIASVSASVPSITFHKLPTITLPPSISSPTHHETLVLETLRLNNPNVYQTLLLISQKYTLHALIFDFFCTTVLSVAAEMNIPVYCFFTSELNCLATFLYLPNLHNNYTKNFKDLTNTFLEIPGVPPILATDMPKPLLERNSEVYKCYVDFSNEFARSAGIIVNTFEEIEPRALKAISDGICSPDKPTPPVYCIGPLTASYDRTGSGSGIHECVPWLDSQPKQSVVLLCFGSLGSFPKQQLTEIAVGLERSRQRFLWVVRNPPHDENRSVEISGNPDPDLNSLLPDGFLERTKDKGLVVKSWIPQVEVLGHDSIGGFVTHCGWNSVLEAVCEGVPMVAWPLYAEQRFNRVVLVEEIQIALPMNELENGIVCSSEVEFRVKELMESKNGELIRERTKGMKDAAKIAMSKNGSSSVALTRLVETWKLKIGCTNSLSTSKAL